MHKNHFRSVTAEDIMKIRILIIAASQFRIGKEIKIADKMDQFVSVRGRHASFLYVCLFIFKREIELC